MTKTILEEAAEITAGDRQAAYGHPERNHGRIAALWAAYFHGKGYEISVSEEDVCYLNILQKVARDMETPRRDNLVDLAGYARNIEILRGS